jgi:hypothetical protein
MALAAYEQYERLADAAAEAKYKRWLIPLAVGFGVLGAAVGTAASGASWLIGLIVGATVGGLLGALIHRLIVHFSSSAAAADQYTDDWCAENSCVNRGDDYSPANGPYHDRGTRRKATLAVEGRFGEFDTLFYNFSYWVKTSNGKTTTEVECPFKIMRMTGVTLPIARLSFSKRGLLDRFRAIDKLQGAMTPERPIELESVEFNKKFDLTIDDDADNVWIRRIFDPATIQECIDGRIDIPDLRYYDDAWWLIEEHHYKASELDTLKAWQTRAAAAIDHLARVPSL